MSENQPQIQMCLESILQRSRTDSAAVTRLRKIKTDYAEVLETDGNPLSMVVCPLVSCGRDRIVAFVGPAVLAQHDGTNPAPCPRGAVETIIDTLSIPAEADV